MDTGVADTKELPSELRKAAAANQDDVHSYDGVAFSNFLSLLGTDFPKGWRNRMEHSLKSTIDNTTWNADPSKPYYTQFLSNGKAYVRRRFVPWPLARISSVNTIQRASFDSYIHRRDAAGQGITIYVLDTGIDGKRTNIQSRILPGVSFVGGEPNEDHHGHGTSITSVLVDPWLGVAPAAKVVSVRVAKDDGMTDETSIIQGLQWVHSHAKPGKSIVNISLTSAKSVYLDAAVLAMYKANIPVFTAAGNFYTNACHYSPASSPGAFTVAASDINDRLMDFSNWGECVDIIAPGYHAPTAWSNGRWNLVSGTR